MLEDAFPEIKWAQPRNNRRGVLITRKYMTPPFAEELSTWVGCPAEIDRLPPQEFIKDALRPPSVYFETEERALQGVCCVCYKKGVLGRCPNPRCGLLMHYSCVPSTRPGEDQQCPICRDERVIESHTELPYWHEAEVGAKWSKSQLRPQTQSGKKTHGDEQCALCSRRFDHTMIRVVCETCLEPFHLVCVRRHREQGCRGTARLPMPKSPEMGKMPFPATRWPSLEEAQLYGYQSLEEWYVGSRAGGSADPKMRPALRVEFKEAEAQRKEPQEDEDSPGEEVEIARKRAIPAPLAQGQGWSKGTAETGRTLVEAGVFDDVGPLVARRMESVREIREVLERVVKAKWEEANKLPDCEMPKSINGEDLRARLKEDQAKCKETLEMISVQRNVLGVTAKKPRWTNPLKGLESAATDYRLSPADQLLERKVVSARAEIWVPVLPNVSIPEEKESKSWRRWAFEWAHCVFLEPHRPSGSTWQTLKRIGYWPDMRRDFEKWINACAVCHQYRTVGQMAPMRSVLASIPELTQLPWSDVIMDCQGPFTRSAGGNSYTLSWHCTFLGSIWGQFGIIFASGASLGCPWAPLSG